MRFPLQRSLVCRWRLPSLMTLAVALGCTSSAGPPPEGRLAIENVGKWHQLYGAAHGGQPPADEKAFVAFIEKKLAERGQQFDPSMLVSPRDGEKYIVLYGKKPPTPGTDAVVVREKTGHDGKVLVATHLGRSREVDAAEAAGLLPGGP
jgi:hypothetical protein